MPAIKGDMYINTHCNYSQPTLIKLDNENIGGHLTPLQTPWLSRKSSASDLFTTRAILVLQLILVSVFILFSSC